MPFNKRKYQAVLNAVANQGIVVYGPRVLLLRDDSEDTSKGGLVIPDEAQKRKKVGTIVAVGLGYEDAGEKEYVLGVSVGHRVTFNAYDGVEHVLDTELGEVPVITMHVGNLYMGWKNREV